MNDSDRCWECGGELLKKKVDFSIYGISLGKFPAKVCKKCGEQLFDEQTSDKMDEIAKSKGLWGLEARTKVGQAGDSLIIRVNKKLAKFLGLKKGEEVTIAPESKEKAVIMV